MGGASFKLDWNGLDRALGSAANVGAGAKQAMAEIGEALVSSTVERFESGEGPDGTSWKPSQRAEKEGGKTLVDSGGSGLMGSIGYEASAANVSVGSNKIYARIHQLGGKAGRGHSVTLPPRPYAGFSEEDIKEARAILAGHLSALLGGRGR
jgi:phage virion morphogenesis protein